MITLDDLSLWLRERQQQAEPGSGKDLACACALSAFPTVANANALVEILRALGWCNEAGAAAFHEIIEYIESSYSWDIWENHGGMVKRVEGPFLDVDEVRVRSLALWRATGIPHVVLLIGGMLEATYQQMEEQGRLWLALQACREGER